MRETPKKSYFFSTNKCIFLGFIMACISMLPFLILNTGSIITYHDQLDGELLSYILTAKYLFTDVNIYPEILNGLPSTGAVAPAPLFVLFYTIWKPFTAFLVSQWIIYVISFVGMFLLLYKFTEKRFVSFAIATIFMLMPFYPVYGLCIPGQPLLLYSIACLYDLETIHDFRNKKNVFSIMHYTVCIILYGLGSSLVLVGFAFLLLLLLWTVFTVFKKFHANTTFVWTPLYALFSLGLTYFFTNFSLLKQVLFPSIGYISHKAEMVLSPQDFTDSFLQVIRNGISYAQSWHTLLLPLIGCVIVVIICKRLNLHEAPSINAKNILTFSSFILIVGLYYAFYHHTWVTSLRNASDGLLKEFNLDRIAWLLPVAWCILTGYVLSYILDDLNKLPTWLKKTFVFTFLCLWGLTVLWNSNLKPNISKIIKGDSYYALDWKSFFAEDIFAQIDTEISSLGKEKENYRVLSIGIYPAAAAYNGFYCLDGYSNNYPLEYKHIFREIMEGELTKSDYVRDFFDNWGNRCYITTAEQANYYTFEKKWNSVIYDLDLNYEKLKELNCQYIFSAAYIMNAEENGLKLMQETPFETEDSWYHIWVYEIK